VNLLLGDCRARLRDLPDASVDAIVSDPPYEISMDMGRGWDSTGIAFDPDLWQQCFRVLKPGGHMLAFSATRTFHRMAVAIEDAGFEVRDTLMWCYSSGFPKSLNVAKAFDKAAGVQGELVGHKEAGLDKGSGASVDMRGAKGRDETGLIPVFAPASEEAKKWSGWGSALKPSWEPIVLARKPLAGNIIETVRAYGTGAINIDGCRVPANDGYEKAWDTPGVGWSGFLADQKGATTEMVDLSAYKPTGGRWPPNILMTHSEECRPVGTKKVGSGKAKAPQYSEGKTPGIGFANALAGHGVVYGEQEVTAWQCHPSCPIGMLEAQTVTKAGRGGAAKVFPQLPLDGDDYDPFFHAGKASRREREEGCASLPLKLAPAIEAAGGDAAKVASAPGAGTGRTATKGVRNNHPTVKPVSVMRWCIRLATQPGGVVLDPFMGSGTTGVAAMQEGMRFVGIEMSDEYMEICKARIGHAAKQKVVARSLDGATGLPTVTPSANTHREPRRSKEAIVFVKSIESNVKRGVKAELGPRTLIIGPNGIGKSSIVNAIELALSGRASDVVGRAEVARGIDLLALAPEADDSLWAKAVLSSGEGANWRCEKNLKTGGAREATHDIPRDVRVTFPVREVRAALEGKPETARVWLLGRIGSLVTEAAVTGLLPEDLRSAYSDICRSLGGTPVAKLLEAREIVARQLRTLSSDAKAAEKLADELGAGLGVEPTEADIEAARDAAREAAKATVVTGWTDPAPLRAIAEQKVAAYQQSLAALNEAKAQVGDAPVADDNIVKLREALVRVMAFTVQNRTDACLVCGTAGIDHASIVGRAQGLVGTVAQDTQVAEARKRVAMLEATVDAAKRAAHDAVVAFQTAASVPAPTHDPVASQAALREAEERLRQLENARGGWQGVRAAKARARDATMRQRLYSDLRDAISEAIGSLLERSRKEFIARVQKLLPESDVFDLVLSDGDREVCKFGFVREGNLHTAVSGAEWARLTLALAAAVASDEERDVSLLTPEERAFDPVSLRAVMAGLSDAPGQVILTSPVAPQGRTPKGWTVIDLTPEEKPKKERKAVTETLGSAPADALPTVDVAPVAPLAASLAVTEEEALPVYPRTEWIEDEPPVEEEEVDERPPVATVSADIATVIGLGGSPAVQVAPPAPTQGPNIDDFFASFLGGKQ